MIKVTVGNNSDNWPVFVSADTTLRQVLEQEEIQYAGTKLFLNGISVSESSLDTTFAQHNITSACSLLSTKKLDNA